MAPTRRLSIALGVPDDEHTDGRASGGDGGRGPPAEAAPTGPDSGCGRRDRGGGDPPRLGRFSRGRCCSRWESEPLERRSTGYGQTADTRDGSGTRRGPLSAWVCSASLAVPSSKRCTLPRVPRARPISRRCPSVVARSPLVGLVALIRLRLPVRATEALAEAVVAATALGLIVVALVLVPTSGWHPGKQLPLLAVPLLDLVMLWLAISLISLTPQHPVGYRYMIAGFACLIAASAASCALALSGDSSRVPLDAVVLWGACLWAGALLHPSHRAAFDPVPARSTRPSSAHVAVLLVCTLLVPAVLLIRLFTGRARSSTGPGRPGGGTARRRRRSTSSTRSLRMPPPSTEPSTTH